jgi:hypothetical protein
MSYIGTPPSNAFTSLLKQDFSTSATTGYTLDHAVNNANDIALFINFVRQEPTAGYAASGTTLTLTSATTSSDDMYCVYLGQALQTVNPANASVGLSQLTATGTKDATTFLRGDNTFAVAGGDNTPAFHAKLSSTQSVSNDAEQKINVNAEDFDTNNCYDNSTNYRFLPTVAGKYWCYGQTSIYGGDVSRISVVQTRLKKNGSTVFYNNQDTRNNQERGVSSPVGVLLDFNGSSDYLEMHCYISLTNTSGSQITGDSSATFFGAYKILT